jgi:hypothetical protein
LLYPPFIFEYTPLVSILLLLPKEVLQFAWAVLFKPHRRVEPTPFPDTTIDVAGMFMYAESVVTEPFVSFNFIVLSFISTKIASALPTIGADT